MSPKRPEVHYPTQQQMAFKEQKYKLSSIKEARRKTYLLEESKYVKVMTISEDPERFKQDLEDWHVYLDDTCRCLHCGCKVKVMDCKAVLEIDDFEVDDMNWEYLIHCAGYPRCSGVLIDLVPQEHKCYILRCKQCYKTIKECECKVDKRKRTIKTLCGNCYLNTKTKGG